MAKSSDVSVVGQSIHFVAGDFDVPLAECREAGDILYWVMQLSDKNWCTLDMVATFVDLAAEASSITIYR